VLISEILWFGIDHLFEIHRISDMNEQISTVRGWRGSADIWRNSLRKMFERCGFSLAQADIDARIKYLVQIGYISMRTVEVRALRLARIATNVEISDRHLRIPKMSAGCP
jgi:hypothetical protein